MRKERQEREEKEEKEIIIPIPKNKSAVIIEDQEGVQIIWKDKEITWQTIQSSLQLKSDYIPIPFIPRNKVNHSEQKVNVLLKLINIRNYFGKPDNSHTGYYIHKTDCRDFIVLPTMNPYMCCIEPVVFLNKEHAEQAIKLLGDEIKYLFTPW